MRALALLAVLALAACAPPKKEPPPRPFAGTKWQVQLELPMPGEQPYLRFGDGRMEGFGGCSRILARYLQDAVGARAIAIGRIDAGARASGDPSAQLAERRMIEVLQAVSSYTINADRMTMSGSSGTLRLRADPPNPEMPP